mgnify:CR=1 FL=1
MTTMPNKDKYKPCNLWTIYTDDPKGLEFLNYEIGNFGSFYHALSYPTKIVAIYDNSNLADVGTSLELTAMDKLCVLENGSTKLLAWNQIFKTEEEAKKAFKAKVGDFAEYIQSIIKLQEFLTTC